MCAVWACVGESGQTQTNCGTETSRRHWYHHCCVCCCVETNGGSGAVTGDGGGCGGGGGCGVMTKTSSLDCYCCQTLTERWMMTNVQTIYFPMTKMK